MRTLRQLLGLCEHKWETIGMNELSRFLPSDRKNSEHVVGHEYILRCEKCGDVKKRRLL